MAELSPFCAALGLDRAAAARVLAAADSDPHGRPPVYVQVLIGIGAWFTAILAVQFLLLLLSLVFDMELDRQAPLAAAVGAACFAAAVALRRDRDAGAFRIQLASALSVAGIGIATAAVAVASESAWAAAAVAAIGTAAAIVEGRDRPTQFISAALAVGLVFAGLAEAALPYGAGLAALLGAAGVALTLYPPRRDLAPLAAVLLLALPCLMAVGDAGVLGGGGAGAAAGAIEAVLTVGLLILHRRLSGGTAGDAVTIALAVAVVLVCALLPPGGSAALMLMMLAFVTGARGLAVIGVLFQIYFVWRFYYDLQVTLLEKSLILMAVGAVVLGAYALVLRRRAVAS